MSFLEFWIIPAAIFLIWYFRRKPEYAKSHFIHYIPHDGYSSQEFYSKLEEAMSELMIPEISTRRQERRDGSGIIKKTKRRDHLIIATTDRHGYLVYAARVSKWFYISIPLLRRIYT